MSGKTKIEWAEKTWNPIRARTKADNLIQLANGRGMLIKAGTWGYHCERVSPGCKNCYACTMNGRTLPAWGTGLDYTVPNREKVEIYLDEHELTAPLRWRKPATIFPCSMTDLFGEWVPDEMIDRMFAVMALCPQHQFLVLTKRAKRMREYFVSMGGHFSFEYQQNPAKSVSRILPLENVRLGVSVEDQQRADERIPELLATPAASWWVSYEPALGPVDFTRYLPHGHNCNCGCGYDTRALGIDWVVIGGESGPGARPCDLAWARAVIAQCREARVPVFFKQAGARPYSPSDRITYRGCTLPMPQGFSRSLNDRKGGDPTEWPEDLRIRETP